MNKDGPSWKTLSQNLLSVYSLFYVFLPIGIRTETCVKGRLLVAILEEICLRLYDMVFGSNPICIGFYRI